MLVLLVDRLAGDLDEYVVANELWTLCKPGRGGWLPSAEAERPPVVAVETSGGEGMATLRAACTSIQSVTGRLWMRRNRKKRFGRRTRWPPSLRRRRPVRSQTQRRIEPLDKFSLARRSVCARRAHLRLGRVPHLDLPASRLVVSSPCVRVGGCAHAIGSWARREIAGLELGRAECA